MARPSWRVRYAEKLAPTEPMVTGQRVDRHALPDSRAAAWRAFPDPSVRAKRSCSISSQSGADADIVVYIGCGERGNEMTDVLREFPELRDPRTGEIADGAHRAYCKHIRYAGRGA